MNDTRTTHQATITRLAPHAWESYLVACPHGCNLGTSRICATREQAERRVRLHRLCTAPLGPHGIEEA